jgi:hypothetical protein
VPETGEASWAVQKSTGSDARSIGLQHAARVSPLTVIMAVLHKATKAVHRAPVTEETYSAGSAPRNQPCRPSLPKAQPRECQPEEEKSVPTMGWMSDGLTGPRRED